MIRRRHSGLISPLVIDDRAAAAQIPRLPFLDGRAAPPCTDLGALFEHAGDDSRIDSVHRQREVVAAERAAKSICHSCPAMLECRAYAIATRQTWGVWGGTNHIERREWLRRNGTTTLDEVTTMGPEELRRKFEGVETIELFSPSALVRTDTGEKIRSTSQRAVAYGNCPSCLRRPAGIIVAGTHWIWRQHFYRTWGNERRMCAASNVALCHAPEPQGKAHNGTPVTCPHGPETAPDEHDYAPVTPRRPTVPDAA